ncbi:MAG TPA: NAD(P)-binding domain-containing protein [Ginsengibacter sp.]|nr:NAD(P)-binding domain-containing protein [Ginsengibacter sp.]
MKIALIGYGRMGKAIEEIALKRGHEIVMKITSANAHTLTKENLRHADVAIEFTKLETAYALKPAYLWYAALPAGSAVWRR